MTRAELIERLVDKYKGLNPRLVDQSVREILEAMIESLSDGKRVELRGFGTFEITVHPPRQAHNPRTGEKVYLGERRMVRFRAGGSLREKVNASMKSSQS